MIPLTDNVVLVCGKQEAKERARDLRAMLERYVSDIGRFDRELIRAIAQELEAGVEAVEKLEIMKERE